MTPAERLASLPGAGADWRDYWALMKPRVMSLVVFTALVGLLVAPSTLPPFLGFVAILCIALGAGASAAFNMVAEAGRDRLMVRTAGRPLPAGRIARGDALTFASLLAFGSVAVMALAIGLVPAALLALSILFYAVAYTLWLKPTTPQNIVIGGAAGAFPPVIGWAAATGGLDLLPLLLFLIIFLWTPPHFWALALFARPDYARAGIPMLPVTHGEGETRRQILVYSLALAVAAVTPWALGLTGSLYGAGAVVLSAIFVHHAWRVRCSTAAAPGDMIAEQRLFRFSLVYLALLFALLPVDRWLA